MGGCATVAESRCGSAATTAGLAAAHPWSRDTHGVRLRRHARAVRAGIRSPSTRVVADAARLRSKRIAGDGMVRLAYGQVVYPQDLIRSIHEWPGQHGAAASC
jgi:hypothetical protein